MIFIRYGAVDQYENALDLVDQDPTSANLILGMAVYQMLRYVFWKNNRYLPHDKDLLAALTDLDSGLASLARTFFDRADLTTAYLWLKPSRPARLKPTASLNGSHLGRILHDPA